MQSDDYYADKLARLTDETLAPADFSHSDHIGIACQALLTQDFFKACSKIGDGIRALAIRGGEAEKYNVTITFIFMSIVGERMYVTKTNSIDEFIQCNPDLSEKSLLGNVYDRERLMSPVAKKVALLPFPA